MADTVTAAVGIIGIALFMAWELFQASKGNRR